MLLDIFLKAMRTKIMTLLEGSSISSNARTGPAGGISRASRWVRTSVPL